MKANNFPFKFYEFPKVFELFAQVCNRINNKKKMIAKIEVLK